MYYHWQLSVSTFASVTFSSFSRYLYAYLSDFQAASWLPPNEPEIPLMPGLQTNEYLTEESGEQQQPGMVEYKGQVFDKSESYQSNVYKLREELRQKEGGSVPVFGMGSIESRRPVVRDETKEMYSQTKAFQDFRKKADEEARRKSAQPSQIIDQTSRKGEEKEYSVKYGKPLCKLLLT